ncbi:MAG: ribonuclease HII [Candidatus Faecimonas sp.]|nr:ribonuclease HII [Mycoplasmatota bacterium]MDY2908118.1 ribonuclease HII [Candidatus Faecimonas sp.]
MKKEEILEKLNSLELDKSKYIIISGASLVCQNLLDETSDIDLACSLDYYNSISWNTKEGYFGSEIKYFDSFEIGTNFYDEAKIVEIDGYRFADVEATYELKKLENKPRDKKLIQKLELLVCSQDNYYFERKLRKTGVTLIAGVDEVGRGPLVGPVVAACVILPEHFSLEGLTDSKKLSEKKRDFYYDEIMRQAISVGIGIISEKKIDEVNIYEATKLAMKEAIDKCGVKPEHVLIDAMPLSVDIPTTSIIKGDFKSITISAASVIAKVTRDRMLDELDKKYPMYDFKDNKGYPTKKHLAAIEEYGIIPEHRKSYGPVRDYLEKQLSLF